MKSVLISIQPKWCALIVSGKKTVEVRKTRPKIDTPFKCYIYETKGKKQYFSQPLPIPYNEGRGKVVGEFVCDAMMDCKDVNMDDTCISIKEWLEYTKNHKGIVYGWHISDLVIYDEPKELTEFFHFCGDDPECEGCEARYYSSTECGTEDYCCSVVEGYKPLTRPPQSWCYVEEGGE